MDITIRVKEAHGSPGKLTKDDVWGKVDEDAFQLLTKGMIVARGLPPVDQYFSLEDKERIVKQTYPSICPVWGDELPYKSVTAICDADQVEEVSYWLEYVHGGGSVSEIRDLPIGKVALRSDYQCW